MNLKEKLSAIQNEFKSKKSRFNKFGNYYYRSAEDILEGLKPYNKKYKVHFILKENLTVADTDFPIIHSIASIVDNESEESMSATAIVGIDLNAKGQQMPQRFGSASSYGKKYALGNLLLIDDTVDADGSNTHGEQPIKQKLQFNEIPKGKSSAKPVIDNKNIDQARKFLSNGGMMKTLEEKYTITKEAKAELVSG